MQAKADLVICLVMLGDNSPSLVDAGAELRKTNTAQHHAITGDQGKVT
jgi:hypothetical protein